MRPADSVLAGAARWLDLLRRSTLTQAWALISNDPRYFDLTRTQYYAALDWLRDSGLLVDTAESVRPVASVRNLAPADTALAVMARALEIDEPPWLADSDVLIVDPADLPQDAESLAEALHLGIAGAMEAVRRAQRKVDLEARGRIGAAGEKALLNLLEAHWPGSTTHVAATDDSAGYDIALTLDRATRHIEVKSTTRRGRLVIYLSRHEYETSLLAPTWRLVVVGLDEADELAALATLRATVLRDRCPHDAHDAATWASTRYVLAREDLDKGLPLVEINQVVATEEGAMFAWMPQ